MKTTLKRGMGRGAAVNGNGRAVYPPGVHTPMKRYRQPEPRRRGAWQVVRTVVLWVVLIVLGTFLRGPNWNFFGPFAPQPSGSTWRSPASRRSRS